MFVVAIATSPVIHLNLYKIFNKRNKLWHIFDLISPKMTSTSVFRTRYTWLITEENKDLLWLPHEHLHSLLITVCPGLRSSNNMVAFTAHSHIQVSTQWDRVVWLSDSLFFSIWEFTICSSTGLHVKPTTTISLCLADLLCYITT